MLKRVLTVMVALAALASVGQGITGASTDRDNKPSLELFKTVLVEAREKGVLSDAWSDVMSASLIDDLIAPEAGETPDETRTRLSLGLPTWEPPFDFLLITVEEAYSAQLLDDGLLEWLSELYIHYLISAISRETPGQIRERLLAKAASTPRPISEDYGTLASPVPFRETAMMGGIAVTLLAANLDATGIVQSWSGWNMPPESGNKFVIFRLRVENVSGSEYAHEVPYYHFGLIGSSGRIVRNSGYGYGVCGGATESPGYRDSLDRGQSTEAVLCFEVPQDEKSPIVFHEHIARYVAWREILGFWAGSEDTVLHEPPIHPPAISDTFGTRADPVPVGQEALTSDGIAFRVLSATLDANQALQDVDEHYRPPSQGSRYVSLRVRIQGFTGDSDDQFVVNDMYAGDFGLITSSGLLLIRDSQVPCKSSLYPDLAVFKGGWVETDLCFEVPIEEQDPMLFYGRVHGFWNLSNDSLPHAPIEPAKPVSDTYGTLAAPAPFGDKASASNGIALTILGADHDVVNGRVVVQVRAEGVEGVNSLTRVRYDSFAMATSSGRIVGSDWNECGRHFYGMEIAVINGGWQEGDLCFNVSPGDTDPILIFLPESWEAEGEDVLGFWAASSDVSPPSLEVPPAISDTFGTLMNPVPAGGRALASDGTVITLTSSIVEASLLGYASSDAHTSVVVRVRLEGASQEPGKIQVVSEEDFGIADASGPISSEIVELECYWEYGSAVQDIFGWWIFGGVWQEGNLCFKVPITRTEGLSVYYQPEGVEQPLGFWAVPRGPAVTGTPSISNKFGTLQNPVPQGEEALASGVLSVSVLSMSASENNANNRPPDEGNSYVTIRVRLENLSGFDGDISVSDQDFGLVAHSGYIIYEADYYHVYQCGAMPDRLDGAISNGESLEGDICFQVPSDQTEGLSLYLSRAGRVHGFWSLSADAPPHAQLAPGTSISDSYGTRSAPVPLKEKATASDGHTITVLSANLNAPHDEHRYYSHGAPEPAPSDDRYVVIRARLENQAIDEGTHLTAGHQDSYGIVTQSGLVKYGREYNCPYTRYSIYNDPIFKGGFAEVDLCFVVPKDESGLTLFYWPDDETIGFWRVSEPTGPAAEPSPPPMEVSDTYGTWMSPVPLGEKALASNGIAISMMDVPDITKVIEDSGEYFPPARPGYKYFVMRARLENFSDTEADALLTVSHSQFSLLTSSLGMVMPEHYGCGSESNSPVIQTYLFPGQLTSAYLFRGGWHEAYLCFQMPVDESIQSVLYRHTTDSDSYYQESIGPALGFWAVSPDIPPTHEPGVPGTPISDSYGRLDSPVPVGEKALTSDDIAVSVLSVNLDANAEFPYPPEPGHRYILARVRIENASESWNEVRHIRRKDFGIALSSGLLRNTFDYYNRNPAMCDWQVVQDEVDFRLFGGMSNEGNLCFQVPEEETEISIFYLPFDSASEAPPPPDLHAPYAPDALDPYVLGYWALPTE